MHQPYSWVLASGTVSINWGIVITSSSLLEFPSLPQWNRALSPEGKCFSYDAKASGFGRGEGAACLFVKRLEDAITSGDPIRAIIRNSACSHSGRSEGITMPSRVVQEKLLLRVHEEVGLRPSETTVVEVHPAVYDICV